jgi:hypothetical protein
VTLHHCHSCTYTFIQSVTIPCGLTAGTCEILINEQPQKRLPENIADYPNNNAIEEYLSCERKVHPQSCDNEENKSNHNPSKPPFFR